MAAAASRKDAAIRIRSENKRILQELIDSVEASNANALEMVEYGNIVLVVVAGHIKQLKVEVSVQASNTLAPAPVTVTA